MIMTVSHNVKFYFSSMLIISSAKLETALRSHQLFHFYYCSKGSEDVLYHFYLFFYILCWILFRPLLMQLVVSSAFCDHRCVFMRVSSWWRAVSVHGVYAGGNRDPSLDGLVTQVPEHSLAQSSLLTLLSCMTGSSGKSLQITSTWKNPQPYLYWLWKTTV